MKERLVMADIIAKLAIAYAVDSIYKKIDKLHEGDFCDIIEHAIIESLGILTGAHSLGEYESLNEDELEALKEIRIVAEDVQNRLRNIEGLDNMSEDAAKGMILKSYIDARAAI